MSLCRIFFRAVLFVVVVLVNGDFAFRIFWRIQTVLRILLLFLLLLLLLLRLWLLLLLLWLGL